MSTVTETEARDKVLTCTAALTKAYALALGAMPEDTHGRLAKALELVEQGGVFESDAGHWEVQSQSQPGRSYTVNGSCGCDWASHHPGNRCTHQFAVLLQRKALQLITASAQADSGDLGQGDVVDVIPIQEPAMTTQPVPHPPAPLPEAPVSITLKATLDGHEVLVTLGGTDFASVREQVEQATAWLKAHAPAQTATVPQPPAQEAPLCKYHGPMKASTKAPGTWYCTRKLADGSYCPSRFPEK